MSVAMKGAFAIVIGMTLIMGLRFAVKYVTGF